jgi:uncharacterized protein YoxC
VSPAAAIVLTPTHPVQRPRTRRSARLCDGEACSLRWRSSPARQEEPVIDFFVLTSGTFGILATFLLVYLALRSVRDARDLRVIQGELTVLMRETKDLAEELHGLQREIRTDQQAAKHGIDETKRTVEQVTEVVEQAADQVVEAAEQVAEVVVERRRPRLPWRRAARVPVSATAAGRGP